jgi:AraC family transcriptional regulator
MEKQLFPLPKIEFIAEKKLVGMKLRMSIAENQTFRLWKGFMPRRKEILGTVNSDLISMQVYAESFDFKNVDINRPFDKWAAVGVSDIVNIPAGMESFLLPAGIYAVFQFKGLPADAGFFFQQIFLTWLPGSDYELDNRPHFEVLGDKYKNNSPDSEEEIWIPVKPKQT